MASSKEGRKNTGLYWNFLENFCFKENKNTLDILEYTGEKNWGTGILLNILENILDYTGILLMKTSGNPAMVLFLVFQSVGNVRTLCNKTRNSK